MPPEDSVSVRFIRKMGCNSTTSVKAIAMPTLLIWCLGTQPWSVTGNNDIPLGICMIQTNTRDVTNQWRGKFQASPYKNHPESLVLFLKLFHGHQKVTATGRSESRIWWCGGSKFMVSEERQPKWGSWGRRPQWYPVAKPLVGSRGKAPWSWRIISK